MVIISSRLNNSLLYGLSSIRHMMTVCRLTDIMSRFVIMQAKHMLNITYNKIINPVCDELLLNTSYESAYLSFPVILDIPYDMGAISAVIKSAMQRLQEVVGSVCCADRLFNFTVNDQPCGNTAFAPLDNEDNSDMLDRLFDSLSDFDDLKDAFKEKTLCKIAALENREKYLFKLTAVCDRQIPLKDYELRKITKAVFSTGEIFSRQANTYGGIVLMCSGFSILSIIPQEYPDVPRQISQQLCEKLTGTKGIKELLISSVPLNDNTNNAFTEHYLQDGLFSGFTFLYD